MIAERHWPADSASVPEARRYAVQTLVGLLPDRLDEIEVMVSELVTNAIIHARTAFTLRITTTAHEVRVEVSDQTPGTVHARRAGPDELHGRGLQIVQTLADRWGVHDTGPHPGKSVWFSIDTGRPAHRQSPVART
jgi:Anti-sigma regulatory factor (Ser/Thr protein kinase)